MKKHVVVVGQKFNMLTVLEKVTVFGKPRKFRCRCECGNIKDIWLVVLQRPDNMSCGCYKRALATKHGMWESREYSSWENMVQRCTNLKCRKYEMYGERGVTVCDRWLRSFKNFYEDMGPRPENTSIDRIDSNKGYFKENCQWSSLREQLVNVRFFHQLVKHDGIVETIEFWLKQLKVDRDIFKARVLRGMNFKQALFCDADIVVLNCNTGQQEIHALQHFLNISGFDKECVIKLLDSDHEVPYSGLMLRYLIGFKGWPDSNF